MADAVVLSLTSFRQWRHELSRAEALEVATCGASEVQLRASYAEYLARALKAGKAALDK